MLTDVCVVLVESSVEHVDRVGGLGAQARDVFERVDGEMEAAHFI